MQEKNNNSEKIFDFGPKIITERIVLKHLDSTSYQAVMDYHIRNRQHFQHSMPEYAPEFYTIKFWSDKLWSEFKMALEEQAFRFYLFATNDTNFDNILGDISIALVLRGTAQSCKIGYKLDSEQTGKGYMSETIEALKRFIFGELQLNRIEANIVPGNEPSIKLIKKMGFREEGIAYKYLKINGKWEDHLRFSLINPDNS